MRRYSMLLVVSTALVGFACGSTATEEGSSSPSTLKNNKKGNDSAAAPDDSTADPADTSTGAPTNTGKPSGTTAPTSTGTTAPTSTGTTAPTSTGTTAPTSTGTVPPSSTDSPTMPFPKVWDGSAEKGSVPVSGGTLLVLKDGKTAVASDPDRDMVSIVDLTSKAVKAQIQLPHGAEPGRVVEDASGQVHVVLRRGGGIADIDLFGGSLVGLRQVCAIPRGIAYKATDNTLLVTCMTGDIVTMSADAKKKPPVSRVTVTNDGVVVDDLRDIILKGDSAYVTTFRSAHVYKVQSDGTVVGKPVLLNTRVDTSKAQLQANGLSGGIDQSYAPSIAWRAVAGASGEIVIVHEGGTDRVINVANADNGGVQQTMTTQCSSSGYGGTTCFTVTGKPICVPPIVIGAVSTISDTGEVSDGPALPNGALPVDIAAAPDGSRYVIVMAGNPSGTNSADGVPLFNVISVPSADPKAGAAANAAVFDADLCGMDFTNGRTVPGQPTAVALDGAGQAVVQTREPATLQYVTAGGVVEIPLSTMSVADQGFDLFHTNTGRGMTCAGCHAEGNDDARTWKFTPGVDDQGQPLKVLVRRTQTFRQGFLETAPFHWDGEFAGIPDLMNDVFVHRMAAAAAPSPERENALELWMNHLPTKIHEEPTAEQLTSIANGKAIFEDSNVGCTTCHSGTYFTNNQNKDIGFDVATQVPSLIDVGFRAPYLHDGSVATLEDRFYDPTALSGKHGKTGQLTKTQIGDLIAYLKSL